jgi:uncharacterized protein YbaR (Trm112 family)
MLARELAGKSSDTQLHCRRSSARAVRYGGRHRASPDDGVQSERFEEPMDLDILRCPVTGERLEVTPTGDLTTSDGRRTYPVIDGVPILIDPSNPLFSVEQIAASRSDSRPTSSRQRLRHLVPSSTYNAGSPRRFEVLREQLRLDAVAQGKHAIRVLVVGGGTISSGARVLYTDPGISLLETDVYLSPQVKVACDGHSLPFAAGSFDGVVIQAVLEHVASPSQVVEETYRVLRDDGLVYAETPFMQQVHEGAFDFTRFTDIGHRRLFRRFAEVERGVAAGPASALAWSLRYFARSLPRRSGRKAALLDALTAVGTAWIKYFDRWLANHRGALDAAAGYYFLGRKAASALDDRELVASYAGSFTAAVAGRGLD